MLRDAGLADVAAKQLPSWHQVRAVFELMTANGLARTDYSPKLCDSLLPILAYKIAEQESMSHTKDARAFATYRNLLDLIDRDYVKFKSIEQIAGHSGISVSYICRLFRQFNHVSPYKYLLSHRMRYAAQLLSNPQFLIKQAAARLEFADQFQFSRAFKRCYGVSPIQFQQQRHLSSGSVN
jgi:AraC-like DNA-binding protein